MRWIDLRAPWASAVPIVGFGLFGYPLISGLSSLLGLPNRPFSIVVRAGVLGFALVLLVWALRGGALRRGQSGIRGVLLLSFFALYTGRLVVDALLYPDGLGPFTLVDYFGYGVGSIFIPALAVLVWPIDGERRDLAWAGLVGCLTALALVGIDLLRFGLGSRDVLEVAQRFGTSTLNPITFGDLGTSAVLLSLWLLVSPSRPPRFSMVQRLLMSLGMASGFAAVVLSGSRGPAGALVLGIVVLAPTLAAEWTRLRAHLLRLVTLFGALAVLLVVRQGRSLALIRRGLDVLTGRGEQSADDRLVRWADAWQTFLADPLIGSGTTPGSYYPHNLMLEALQGSGIVAGALLLAIYLGGAVQVGREWLRPRRLAWTTVLWVQFAAHTLVSGALWDVTAFWIFTAVIASRDLRSAAGGAGVAGGAGSVVGAGAAGA